MYKAATISTRIEPELKAKAERILHDVGITSAEAVRIFYKQICLQRGLPFDVKLPNKETLKAMREADMGKTHKAKNVDALFDHLD